MFFRKEEKVFSLSGTSDLIQRHDLRSLWSEFYAYLLLTGFFLEGQSDAPNTLYTVKTRISDPTFNLWSNTYDCYSLDLGNLIARGLRDRFIALTLNSELSAVERSLLQQFDGIFADNSATFLDLSAKQILAVATHRQFDPAYQTIAHYAAVTFGQKDFPDAVELPCLYLSLFGNIHLAQEDRALVGEPLIRYRQRLEDRSEVTPLWAFFSAQLDGLAQQDFPGNILVEHIAMMTLLAAKGGDGGGISVPRRAAMLGIQALTDIDRPERTGKVAQRFYRQLFYGYVGDINISRHGQFTYILDLMVNKMGKTRQDRSSLSVSIDARDCVFTPGSIYQRLVDSKRIYGREPRASSFFEYALEALDASVAEEAASDKADDSATSSEETPNSSPEAKAPIEREPSTEVGGHDPSAPPISGLDAGDTGDMDTIGLISFDKTGEGVDEDLYRSAVVALNDKLKRDGSSAVTADIKDALDHWVNEFLYRAAIAATKEQIVSLGLQKYLKTVSTKG